VSGLIYAGTASGLIRSTDGGATWRTVSPQIARGIAFEATHPGRLYVATDNGVLRSDDAGLHLRESNRGLCNRRLSRLTESGGIVVGSEWESKDAREPLVIVPAASAPPASDAIYALAGGALMRSTDAGHNWAEISVPARLIAVVTRPGGALLAASESAVFRSEDDGASWTQLQLPAFQPPIQDLVGVGASSVAAISRGEILLSSNGVQWSTAASLPGNPVVRGLAGSGFVLLAATSSGLMRSFDFGRSWSPVPGDLGATSIEAVAADPSHRRGLLAAAFGFVYASTDDGESWRRILPEGPAMGAIRQLLPSSDPERLFALTEAHGAFVLVRKGSWVLAGIRD